VLDYLVEVSRKHEAGFLVLLDPDRKDPSTLMRMAERAAEAGADALLVGSSLLLHEGVDRVLAQIKPRVSLPLILFPGNSNQLSPHANAVLFLCLVSGRNPELLIGEHVRAAPQIRQLGLEPIPVGYLLVE
jgi:phosphoglycerol geranylgeranyltransferase